MGEGLVQKVDPSQPFISSLKKMTERNQHLVVVPNPCNLFQNEHRAPFDWSSLAATGLVALYWSRQSIMISEGERIAIK